MTIRLVYGDRQQFRYRYRDINILGSVEAGSVEADAEADVEAKGEITRSEFRVNEGEPVHFYLEPRVTANTPGKYPYGCKTPSCHRLRDRPGHFNLEIPIVHPDLTAGWNRVLIEIEQISGEIDRKTVEFSWNPQPLPLPLDLSDLSRYKSIQEIGQAVNGAFDLDAENNLIRARSPVGSDSLLLLGSPHQSQEATYDVKFTGKKLFMGVSDFFTAHVEQSPNLGIKPGYCTSGLATINAQGSAQIWLAWGDNLMDNALEWVVKTEERIAPIDIEIGALYHVRHQTLIGNDLNCSRFRIWPQGKREPKTWLCEEHNYGLAPHFYRNKEASFGLFQYFGSPTEWSNIRVSALDMDISTLKLRRTRKNYLKRARRSLQQKFVNFTEARQ